MCFTILMTGKQDKVHKVLGKELAIIISEALSSALKIYQFQAMISHLSSLSI